MVTAAAPALVEALVEQLAVGGRRGAAFAACDFQQVAIYRAALGGGELMHYTVIATAQAFPTIPEIGGANSLQCIREHRVPHQFER